jgi:hypothetical protein
VFDLERMLLARRMNTQCHIQKPMAIKPAAEPI